MRVCLPELLTHTTASLKMFTRVPAGPTARACPMLPLLAQCHCYCRRCYCRYCHRRCGIFRCCCGRRCHRTAYHRSDRHRRLALYGASLFNSLCGHHSLRRRAAQQRAHGGAFGNIRRHGAGLSSARGGNSGKKLEILRMADDTATTAHAARVAAVCTGAWDS